MLLQEGIHTFDSSLPFLRRFAVFIFGKQCLTSGLQRGEFCLNRRAASQYGTRIVLM
jgi:hypothetical protein